VAAAFQKEGGGSKQLLKAWLQSLCENCLFELVRRSVSAEAMKNKGRRSQTLQPQLSLRRQSRLYGKLHYYPPAD